MVEHLDHELRRHIILKLIHHPRLTYNQLWEKRGESNQFAYHLKKMEEEGLVGKYEDGYGLTQEGRKLSASIEGDTGGKAEMVTPTVVVFVRQGNTLLAQERLKEPFYGTWGVVSGKINFGWNPVECAVRDLKEETDLVAHDPRLRILECVKTFEGERLLHHHLMYIVEVTQFSGTLKERTHKARHAWLTLEEYKAKPRFPGDWALDALFGAQSKPDDFFIVEAERYLTDGAFAGSRVVRHERFTRST